LIRSDEVADTHVEQFQQWLDETYGGDERFAGRHRVTGADAGLRLEAGENSYYEIGVWSGKKIVRVGFLTADRALNEAIEQGILDSGDSLDELMEVELDDLGEEAVTMEHYFERPAFCYTSTIPLPDTQALSSADLRRRIGHLVDACAALFQEYLED
jgi:hypothetical protein